MDDTSPSNSSNPPPPFTPPPITPLPRTPPPGTPAGTPPPISPPPGANPPPPPPSYPPNPEGDARTWNMLCHLSVLSGLCLPVVGNILGPLLVWLLKKNEFPSVEAHGKAALNFQLTMLIAIAASAVAFVVLHLICLGFLFVPLLGLLPLAAIIFPIVAAVKASNGEPYQYPYSLDLVR